MSLATFVRPDEQLTGLPNNQIDPNQAGGEFDFGVALAVNPDNTGLAVFDDPTAGSQYVPGMTRRDRNRGQRRQAMRHGRGPKAKAAPKPARKPKSAAKTKSPKVERSQTPATQRMESASRGRPRREKGALRTVTIGDHGVKGRAARKAYRQARKQTARPTVQVKPEKKKPNAGLPSPLPNSRLWGPARRGGLWGPVATGQPWHVTSSARIGGATVFLAPRPTAIKGPIIGLEVTSRQPFTYDPWEAIQSGMVTSPSVVVLGLMGKGKSYCVKLAMIRLVENGRQVIVSSDPKGEWIQVALTLGGQVIDIGPTTGNVINPLDEGTRPVGVSEESWRRLVVARRALALEGICYTLRKGKQVDEFEQACLNQIVEDMSDGLIKPTVRAAVEALRNPSKELVAEAGADAPRVLALTLMELVRGPLAGMFDTESTVKLDPLAPMIVINTRGLGTGASKLKQIAAATTAAWIDATLRSGDGRWRCIVSEEAWDELRIPALAQAMDERLRMTSDWRCSNWLIIHELSDINQFGEPGSAHRNIVESIITKSETKILYAQNQASLEAIDKFIKPTRQERNLLTTLRRGVGLWHIGQQTPIMVQPYCGPTIYSLINTDAGRSGRDDQ